jgi:hypothetical protein
MVAPPRSSIWMTIAQRFNAGIFATQTKASPAPGRKERQLLPS